MRRCVIVESPYAGNVALNGAYARAAIRDCLRRGEAPFASHLLYTQDGVLRDEVAEDRAAGIDAGLDIGRRMDATIVYTDLGISKGMEYGVNAALAAGRTIEYRVLGEFQVAKIRESVRSRPIIIERVDGNIPGLFAINEHLAEKLGGVVAVVIDDDTQGRRVWKGVDLRLARIEGDEIKVGDPIT